MDTLYHTTTTTTVTRNPYLPAIGRVLEVLRAHWRGVPFAIGHRALAAAAGCSAGRIPAIMRQLEADGHVRRIPHGMGYLIAIRAPDDQQLDRPAPAAQPSHAPAPSGARPAAPGHLPPDPPSAGDQGHDRPPAGAPPDQALDRAAQMTESPITAPCGAASHRDQRADRAPRRMDDHDSRDQHQHRPSARAFDDPAGAPLYAALVAAGAQPGVAAAIVRACPERTPDRLTFALAAARRRGKLPCPPEALVFGLWRRGEYLIEERDYGRGSGKSGELRGDGHALGAGAEAGGRPRGGGARPRARLAEPVLTEADLPAWLREFRAAQRAADAAPV